MPRSKRLIRKHPSKFEFLEPRQMLAGAWQNPAIASDVDNSGTTRITDLLAMISFIRENPFAGQFPETRPAGSNYYDVTGDDKSGIDDVLGVLQPLREGLDQPQPEIAAALANDTGTPDDSITADPRLLGQILSGLTDGTTVVAQFRPGEWRRVDLANPDSFLIDAQLLRNGLDDDPYNVRVIAQNYGGPFQEINVAFQLQTPGATLLKEEDRFATEASMPVELGQTSGSRMLRFEVNTRFDTSDTSANLEDVLLVYLRDPNDPSTTLLDRGEQGTSLLGLAGNKPDFPLGRVRFDGSMVEIDVTGVSNATTGELVFQLLNSDADEGTRVAVRDVTDTLNPDGFASPFLARGAALGAPGPAIDLTPLDPSASVEVIIENVRFDAETGRYAADLRLRNHGAGLIRRAAVLLEDLPPEVSVVNASDADEDGTPYFNFAPAIPARGIAPHEFSSAITVQIDNVDLERFSLRTSVLAGGENQAPVMDPIGPLSAVPGDFLSVPLTATDADGDAITWRIDSQGPLPTGMLTAQNTLVFTPAPGQEGSYAFDVVAGDGVAETRQIVMLDVETDPLTTTRISGLIYGTTNEPLDGVPVEIAADAYKPAVLADSPAGYWRLGERAGPDALDSSVNAVTGQYQNGVALGAAGALAGHSNTSAAFDGVNDVVTVPDHSAHRPSQLTLEAWVFPAADAPNFATVLMKTSSSSWTDGYGLYRTNDGKLHFFINHYDNNDIVADLPSDEWTHVVAVYDGSEMRLYFDGQLVASQAFTGAINHSTQPLRIGSGQGSFPWKGRLDEVAIYGSALTELQVMDHYDVGTTAPTPLSTVTDENGAFLLETAGELPGNALVIRGNEFQGNETYPFVAEGISLLLGREVYLGHKNVIGRPIFLPALDTANAVQVDPNQDTTIDTDAIPGMEVFVEAGTLMNRQGDPFQGMMSITQVPPSLTPAALPRNVRPDLVVTIQPADMVFTTPAPISFPNSQNYPPGTLMDLWSINPDTGLFDIVGQMQVSSDGSVIETISGGIRNSSWHFPAPPPDDPDDPMDDDHNEDNDCEECKATAQSTSRVELHSGAVLEMHDLVGYQSLGQSRGLSLHYDSMRADPRPIIHFGYTINRAGADRRLVGKLSIQRGDLMIDVPGAAAGPFGLSGGEHIWRVDQTGDVRAAIQADLRNAPSGLYDYVLESGVLQLGSMLTGATSMSTGKLRVVNSIDSMFGAGWGLADLQQVIENPDGSVLLVNGDGGEMLYGPPANAGDPYDSPPGDFSQFVKLPDGTFRRTMTDQTIYEFDAEGRISLMRDRNGNETQWEYNGQGLLTKIIDPVGLETVFAAAGNRITSITDPANRTTQLEYDAEGNLVRVTDPDGTSRTWEYDSEHHIIAEVDKRNFRE